MPDVLIIGNTHFQADAKKYNIRDYYYINDISPERFI